MFTDDLKYPCVVAMYPTKENHPVLLSSVWSRSRAENIQNSYVVIPNSDFVKYNDLTPVLVARTKEEMKNWLAEISLKDDFMGRYYNVDDLSIHNGKIIEFSNIYKLKTKHPVLDVPLTKADIECYLQKENGSVLVESARDIAEILDTEREHWYFGYRWAAVHQTDGYIIEQTSEGLKLYNNPKLAHKLWIRSHRAKKKRKLQPVQKFKDWLSSAGWKTWEIVISAIGGDPWRSRLNGRTNGTDNSINFLSEYLQIYNTMCKSLPKRMKNPRYGDNVELKELLKKILKDKDVKKYYIKEIEHAKHVIAFNQKKVAQTTDQYVIAARREKIGKYQNRLHIYEEVRSNLLVVLKEARKAVR